MIEPINANKGVTVITATNRPDYMERLLANYQRQDYPNKQLIIVLNNNHFDMDQWQRRIGLYRGIELIHLQGNPSLGFCYNYALSRAKYDLVAKFDDDDYYAPQYLLESTRHFANTNADIVGKTCRYIFFADLSTLALYCPSPEDEFVNYVAGATMIIKKKVFEKIVFPDITFGDDSEFQRKCLRDGFNIFSGDRHHYVTIRQSSAKKHTFQLDDREYLAYCQSIGEVPAELVGVKAL